MKKLLLQSLKLLLVLPIMSAACFSVQAQQKAQASIFSNGVLRGVVNIKLAPQIESKVGSRAISAKSGKLVTGVSALDVVAQRYKATAMQRVFPYDAKHEEQLRRHGLHLWYKLTFDPNVDVKQAITAFSKLSEITVAQPVYEKKLNDGYLPGSTKVVTPLNRSSVAANFPNDPYFSQQWHYNNTGQNGGTPGADINLVKAWEITKGSANVIVAVHDVGMDVRHEDLRANLWINMAEANGKPGVDDDLNGYVDDINGYNYVTESGAIDPDDHATHVAGTIAAVNNNGIGVSGVAGGTGKGDGARIMSLKILGGASPESIALSYIYAANNGAVISQNSWGYNAPGVDEQIIHEAIKYFVAEAGRYPGSPMRGGLVLFASGNSGADGQWYPGYYDEVIAVSALNKNNVRTYFSNYGNWVDISAPGGEQTTGNEDGILSLLPNNRYGYFQGTSMACPHVAGIAALVVSKYGGPGFTAEKLKQHILTGVKNVYEANPDDVGNLGAGYADAELALKTNNLARPERVNDLAVTSATQDAISVSFKVPVDRDDNYPATLRLYYDTKPITSATLSKSRYIVLRNWEAAGTLKEYTFEKLSPLTKYYFAVVAIDRWNNVSDLSNIIEASTTAGPVISVDKSSLAFNLDAKTGLNATNSFNIANAGAGNLLWNTIVRQRATEIDMARAKARTLKSTGSKANVKHRVGMVRATAVRTTIKPKLMAFEPIEMYYSDFPTNVIGDNDLSVPNSSATKFIVNSDQGFNLTHVRAYLNIKKADVPIVVEVFKGGVKPEPENLIYSQTTPSLAVQEYYTIRLDQQVNFNQNEEFWIVIHTPAGNQYPLGMGYLINETTPSGYFLMSFDTGASWTTLANAIAADGFAWNVMAQSLEPHNGEFITLDPSSGEIEGNPKALSPVNAHVDAANLVNGNYSNVIVINSNDPAKKEVRIPVDVKVTNRQPELNLPDIVEFGTVFIGKQKQVSVRLENKGYGNYSTASVNASDGQFTINDPGTIQARSQTDILLTFKPERVGTINASLTLTDDKGLKYQLSLFAVAAEPAQLKIEPAERSFDLAIGDTASAAFTITNTGKYPLKYVAPKFSKKVLDEVDPKKVSTYGYSFKVTGEGYNWTEISTDGKDITETFKPINSYYYAVDLGFSINFFGRKVDKLFITRRGALTCDNFADLSNSSTPDIKADYMPNGYISASYIPYDFNKGGHVYYKREPGKLIVEYKNVYSNYFNEATKPATFQIIVFDTGNIQYLYDQVDETGLTDYFVAVEGFDREDALLIQNLSTTVNISNKTVVNIVSPGAEMVTAFSSPDGIIAPGASKPVTLKLNTDSLTEGSHTQNITLFTNDPQRQSAYLTVKVNAKGGTTALALDQTQIDFGKLQQGSTGERTVVLSNTGTAQLKIESVSLGNRHFTFSGEKSFVVKAKSKVFIDLRIDSTKAVGVYNDVLTIKPANAKLLTVKIKAQVIPSPAISVEIKPIAETLAAGESKERQLTIDNSAGKASLEVIPTAAHWLSLYDKKDTKSAPAYSWTDSRSADGPKFEWIDLIKQGTRIDYSGNSPETSKAIELPFEFEYYGKKYKKVYIGLWAGAISFTDTIPEASRFGPSELPSAEAPNTYLAPCFTRGGIDVTAPKASSGIFYKYFDDKVVISYENFISSSAFAGGNISFQIILYKNGTFKFQYNGVGDEWGVEFWIRSPLVGIENHDGTSGVLVARDKEFIINKLAVAFQPSYKLSIPAGQSKVYDLKFDATTLSAGEYNTNLTLQNNTPSNANVIIPVSLSVSGAPLVVIPDTINVGTVMISAENRTTYTYFDIVNSGNAPFIINSMAFNNSASLSLESGKEVQSNFGLDTIWTPVNDVLPNEQLTVTTNETALFRLVVDGTKPIVFNNTLTIAGNAQIKPIRILGTVAYPPVMSVYEKSIIARANTATDVVNKSFTIDNTKGQSELTYDLSIKYERQDEQPTGDLEIGGLAKSRKRAAVASKVIRKPITRNNTYSRLTNPVVNAASNVLEYDNATHTDGFLGMGVGTAFWTATAFVAGSDGFNLSKVQTYMMLENTPSAAVNVEIWAGEDITTARRIHTQRFQIQRSVPDKGSFETFSLSDVKKIYPNEKFFVLINYPLGVQFPQGVTELTESLPGTFFFFDELNWMWVDLASQDGLNKTAFMVKAIADDNSNNGWVNIASPLKGTVANGTKKTVDIKFTAANTQNPENRAQVIVNGNDPVKNRDAVALTFQLNQPPAFVKVPQGNQVSIKESRDTTVILQATDPEKDKITYSVANAPAWITFQSADSTVRINLKPGYADAGSYSLTVNATDAYQHVTGYKLNIEVVNNNRPPVAAIDQQLTLRTGIVYRAKQAPWFSDADSDPITYKFIVANSQLLQVSAVGDEFIFNPLRAGTTTLKLIGDDGQGGVDTLTVNAVIRNNNSPVIVTQPGSLVINIADGLKRINLGQYFTDADGDTLRYTSAINDSTVARLAVERNELTITPLKVGDASVMIITDDGAGGTASAPLLLKVVTGNNQNLRAYPNPVATSTTIEYLLPKSGSVLLRVFDVSGKVVRTLVKENQNIGNYKIEFNMSGMTPGLYFYSLSFNNEDSITQKLIKQ
ncbi:S8 family serine peptidase [Mucilaginibacter defluvii]